MIISASTFRTADPGSPVVSLVAQTTAGATAYQVAAAVPGRMLEQGGPFSVIWTRDFPGTAPVAQTTVLEYNDGDPSDDTQWQIADTENTVTPNHLDRVLAGQAARFWRLRVTAITTPGGGVSGQIRFA